MRKMRLRLWSKQHDGRYCSLCQTDALYVMEMRIATPPFEPRSHHTQPTRFCQSHIDEIRTMFGHDAEQFYPQEENPDTIESDIDKYHNFDVDDWNDDE